MPPTNRSFDYFDHRVLIEPTSPGRWRYRVWQLHHIAGSDILRTGPLVCDLTTMTRWNAAMRARDLIRRRRRRKARWPHHQRP